MKKNFAASLVSLSTFGIIVSVNQLFRFLDELTYMIDQLWNQFLNFLKIENQESLKKLNPPATKEQLQKARTILGPLFHEDIEEIYKNADGFVPEAYLLRDTYRILPLDEMLEKSLKLVGEVFTTDVMSGEYRKSKKLKIVIFAVTQQDDEDISQVGFFLRRNKPTIIIWFKEGGVHTFEEVVETSETLEDWFSEMME